MGAWSEEFFSSDSASDWVAYVSDALVFHNESRKIICKLFGSITPPIQRVLDFQTQLNQIQEYMDANPNGTQKNFLAFLHKTPVHFDKEVRYELGRVLFGNSNLQFSYKLTPEDLQVLFPIMVQASFHKKDHAALKQETLTPHGILNANKTKYIPSETYDPDVSFYGLGLAMANLPTHNPAHAVEPYYFKQFLTASTHYFSTPQLSSWRDIAPRFAALEQELTHVVSRLATNPENIEVLKNHYNEIIKLNKRSTPEEQRYLDRGEVKILPPEKKAYEGITIKSILEKSLLSDTIGLGTDKVNVDASQKFKI